MMFHHKEIWLVDGGSPSFPPKNLTNCEPFLDKVKKNFRTFY